jgi:type II secretory pathway component PulC
MRVTIYRRTGYLAGAGLRDGDMVIGLDGEEFASEARMEAAFALAREKPTVTLIVLRGAARLALNVDPSRMQDLVDAGGSLQPFPR